MILDTQLKTDDKGVITSPQSAYLPETKVKDITSLVLGHFEIANRAKTQTYREFNGMTLMERQSVDQSRFNSYQFSAEVTPDEEWKSNAVRPITRNRVISIAAHLTGNVIYPQVFAQNQRDEEDQATATVMRDLMEWRSDQANYEKTFVFAVIAALVNPAVIIHTEYAEVYRTVKEEMEDNKGEDESSEPEDDDASEESPEPASKYQDKVILDEEFSGFQDSIVPLDEWYMPDFYENNVQRQDYVLRRRAITFETANTKHGHHQAFQDHVRPGLQILYAESTGLFYEEYDHNLQERLVEEIIYWNRSKDLMLIFCNGVLVTEYNNPNPRQDHKYPFVMFGYEPLDEGKFAFYKSAVNKLGPDEETIQTLYRMIIDGTYLQLMPPAVVYGDEAVTSNIMAPGVVTSLKAGSELKPMTLGSNLQAGMAMLNKVEESMSESSIDPSQAGVSDTKTQTAYEIGKVEQNAKVMLGLFGRMIGFGIKEFGNLVVSDIIQYATVGELMQITSGDDMMQFRSFLLPGKAQHGGGKSKRISFSMDMPTENITQGEKDNMGFDLLNKTGMDGMELVDVNVMLFREMKFKIKVSPDIITPPSDNLSRALKLEEYDRAIASPFANQENLYRDLLLGSYDATKENADKYIKTPAPSPLASAVGADAGPAGGQTNWRSNQVQQTNASQIIKSGAGSPVAPGR